LQFQEGENVEGLGLTGEEIFTLGTAPGDLKAMLDSKFAEGKKLSVVATAADGNKFQFSVTVRIDTPQEILYYQHGGILQYVLRQLAGKA